MLYVKYPTDTDFCSWEDIGCLCIALGFPRMLIQQTLKSKMPLRDDGIPLLEFQRIIEQRKYLEACVDRTYNLHTDEWNLLLLEKALSFIHSKIISYPDLHLIRLAYQAYEMDDSKGMVLDVNTLQRSLKLCNRMISPMKMLHRLKHMKKSFADRERIQLHEFLDLLLWCDEYVPGDFTVSKESLATDKFDLYELKNFNTLLSYYDQRLRKSLDAGYLKEEWRFGGAPRSLAAQGHVENIGISGRDMPPVHTHNRINMAKKQKRKYVHLKRQLDLSNNDVGLSRAGYLRPANASDRGRGLAEYFRAKQDCVPHRPLSVRETLSRLTTGTDSRSAFTRADDESYFQSETPQSRPQTAPTVTEIERKQTQNEMNNLKFDMEIIEIKHKQYFNEEIDYMLPDLRNRKEALSPKKSSNFTTFLF